jgi:cytidine deaminase
LTRFALVERRPTVALEPTDRELCSLAANAARNAYAPYSKFTVGSAVRTSGGKTYVGANLENAAYGVGICAEVAAITAANSAGDFDIESIAIVGHPMDDPRAGPDIVTPCGRCRQIIFEAAQVSGRDIRVIACNGDLSECQIYPISKLLTDGFGPANLGMNVARHRKKGTGA